MRQSRASSQPHRGLALRALVPTLLPMALLVGLAACGGGSDDEGFACTLEMRPALLVEPVDGLGQVLSDVQITWRVDAGASQSLLCNKAPCAVFDRAGDYELAASKPGHASASLRVRVTQGRCHLQTESWRPVLARQ